MRCFLIVLAGTCVSLTLASRLSPSLPLEGYEMRLKQLLQKILWAANVKRCFGVITDDLHYPIYDRNFFQSVGRQVVPFFVMRLNASEDLLKPPKQVELVLGAIKSSDCEVYFITLLNGWQAQRFLRYIYNTRSLNMQKKFILLHDSRLFERDMIHIWSVFVGTVFLKYQLDTRWA